MRGLVDFTAREFGGLDALVNVAADLSAQNIGTLLLIEAWIATSSQRGGASADTPTAAEV